MLSFLKRLLRLTDGGQTPPPTLLPFDHGLVALIGNQYALAIAQFDAVLRQQPGNATAHLGRGTASSRLGEVDKAMADYTEAIRLAPNNALAFCNRGRAKRTINDASGNADIVKARQLDPSVCP